MPVPQALHDLFLEMALRQLTAASLAGDDNARQLLDDFHHDSKLAAATPARRSRRAARSRAECQAASRSRLSGRLQRRAAARAVEHKDQPAAARRDPAAWQLAEMSHPSSIDLDVTATYGGFGPTLAQEAAAELQRDMCECWQIGRQPRLGTLGQDKSREELQAELFAAEQKFIQESVQLSGQAVEAQAARQRNRVASRLEIARAQRQPQSLRALRSATTGAAEYRRLRNSRAFTPPQEGAGSPDSAGAASHGHPSAASQQPPVQNQSSGLPADNDACSLETISRQMAADYFSALCGWSIAGTDAHQQAET
eukprot:SAG22_NODE_219_length_14877_cov_14.334619_17_plen_311_part_00